MLVGTSHCRDKHLGEATREGLTGRNGGGSMRPLAALYPQAGRENSAGFLLPPFFSVWDSSPWNAATHNQIGAILVSYASGNTFTDMS